MGESIKLEPLRTTDEVLSDTFDILLLILAIFLPPLVVFLKRGCDIHLLLNILLWIFLFGIGGIIHAWYIVFVTKGNIIDK